MKTELPNQWLMKSNILAAYNIGWRRLEQWVVEGYVRSVKLDEGQHGRRLYSTLDMEKTLCALAEGKEPKRNGGRK